MNSHEIDYELIGDDMQIVEIELDPGETVVAEAGAMNYMEDEITFEAKMGDGSQPNQGLFGKLLDVGKRALTGESIFMTHFTNNGVGKRRVSFAAPYPGKIICVDLARASGKPALPKGRFPLCRLWNASLHRFAKETGSGFFGGEGFILQKLSGDGKAFVHAGGTVVKKELNGETLRVDTGCIVAFEESVRYDIQMAGGLKSMVLEAKGSFSPL